MKKSTYFLLSSLIIFLMTIMGCGKESIASNPQDIGHLQLEFYDTARDDRLISAELFYPASVVDGKSTITKGRHPLIVFAHGYQQRYEDYHYLYEALVPLGYHIAFLTTEQGLSIDIDTYAEDIVFLEDKLLQPDSFIGLHVSSKSALMGHSTGGGAIYLAQALSAKSTTLISLAALGKPFASIYGSSPIDIADIINIPTLILSGEKDCVTDPLIHQKPLYDNLLGDKTMITLLDGDHCGFSDSLNCPIGESLACGLFFQGTTIDDATQRALTIEIIQPWLNHFLKDKPDAWSSFTNSIGENIEILSSF